MPTLTAEEFSASQHYVIRREVEWGQMDAFAHVNNTVYFRWAEAARIEHFHALGLMEYMEQHQVGPILASIETRFRIPLTYPDEVLIGSKIGELQQDRFAIHHRVYSVNHQKIAGEGEGLVVCFDYANNRKAAVPEPVRGKIEALIGG